MKMCDLNVDLNVSTAGVFIRETDGEKVWI